MALPTRKSEPNSNLINVLVACTWVSGLVTAAFLAERHPVLAWFSLLSSFTVRLRLPEKK